MTFFTNRYVAIEPGFKPEKPQKQHVRINTLKAPEEEIVRRLKKAGVKLKTTPLPLCYEYSAEFSLASTVEYLQGLIYPQGLASQAVAHALAPQEGWTIVDMAAAPGSKTTHLAQLMNNAGVIVALDKSPERLLAVRNNCERLGVLDVVGVRKDARFASDLKLEADAVLLDAPCSGNYCSEEGWFEKRILGDIAANARVQKELFKSAVGLLKPGGVLVYSTCSLEPEEDELVIDWALKKYPDLTLEELPLPAALKFSPATTSWEGKALDSRLALARRSWPHLSGTEGFFIARLRRH